MDSVALSTASASLIVPDDWAQGRTVYGGLQAALAMKAMEAQVEPERLLRTFQAAFIGPVNPGAITADAAIMRKGKSSTQVSADIEHDDRKHFSALAIFAQERQSTIRHLPKAPPPSAAFEQCEEGRVDDNTYSPFNPHMLSRWPPGLQPYVGATNNRFTVYVRHRDDTVTSSAHFVALADAIPPIAVTQLKDFAPLSTMTWQLDVQQPIAALADETWFRFDIEIDACRDGYCTQSTHIWTLAGDLVAVSRQNIAVFG